MLWNSTRYDGKNPNFIHRALFDRVRAVIAQRNDIRAMAHRFACGGLLNVFRRGESSRPASSRREQ